MKKILSFIISISLTVGYFGQYCSTGGPTSTFDSNVESVSLLGENTTSINYIGCPGITGVENQTTLTVDLVADSTYSIDVQFGTCGGNYNSAGEAWIDWNQNTIFEANESIEAIAIFDLNGALVQTELNTAFSIKNLNQGVYIVHVKTANGVFTKRLIKE